MLIYLQNNGKVKLRSVVIKEKKKTKLSFKSQLSNSNFLLLFAINEVNGVRHLSY